MVERRGRRDRSLCVGGAVNSIQWAAFIVACIAPTVAAVTLFVRFGSFIQAVRDIKTDMDSMSKAVEGLSKAAAELQAWRDANKSAHEDLLERVRRLEQMALDK